MSNSYTIYSIVNFARLFLATALFLLAPCILASENGLNHYQERYGDYNPEGQDAVLKPGNELSDADLEAFFGAKIWSVTGEQPFATHRNPRELILKQIEDYRILGRLAAGTGPGDSPRPGLAIGLRKPKHTEKPITTKPFLNQKLYPFLIDDNPESKDDLDVIRVFLKSINNIDRNPKFKGLLPLGVDEEGNKTLFSAVQLKDKNFVFNVMKTLFGSPIAGVNPTSFYKNEIKRYFMGQGPMFDRLQPGMKAEFKALLKSPSLNSRRLNELREKMESELINQTSLSILSALPETLVSPAAQKNAANNAFAAHFADTVSRGYEPDDPAAIHAVNKEFEALAASNDPDYLIRSIIENDFPPYLVKSLQKCAQDSLKNLVRFGDYNSDDITKDMSRISDDVVKSIWNECGAFAFGNKNLVPDINAGPQLQELYIKSEDTYLELKNRLGEEHPDTKKALEFFNDVKAAYTIHERYRKLIKDSVIAPAFINMMNQRGLSEASGQPIGETLNFSFMAPEIAKHVLDHEALKSAVHDSYPDQPEDELKKRPEFEEMRKWAILPGGAKFNEYFKSNLEHLKQYGIEYNSDCSKTIRLESKLEFPGLGKHPAGAPNKRQYTQCPAFRFTQANILDLNNKVWSDPKALAFLYNAMHPNTLDFYNLTKLALIRFRMQKKPFPMNDDPNFLKSMFQEMIKDPTQEFQRLGIWSGDFGPQQLKACGFFGGWIDANSNDSPIKCLKAGSKQDDSIWSHLEALGKNLDPQQRPESTLTLEEIEKMKSLTPDQRKAAWSNVYLYEQNIPDGRTILLPGPKLKNGFSDTPLLIQNSVFRLENNGGVVEVDELEFHKMAHFILEQSMSFVETQNEASKLLSSFWNTLGTAVASMATLNYYETEVSKTVREIEDQMIDSKYRLMKMLFALGIKQDAEVLGATFKDHLDSVTEYEDSKVNRGGTTFGTGKDMDRAYFPAFAYRDVFNQIWANQDAIKEQGHEMFLDGVKSNLKSIVLLPSLYLTVPVSGGVAFTGAVGTFRAGGAALSTIGRVTRLSNLLNRSKTLGQTLPNYLKSRTVNLTAEQSAKLTQGLGKMSPLQKKFVEFSANRLMKTSPEQLLRIWQTGEGIGKMNFGFMKVLGAAQGAWSAHSQGQDSNEISALVAQTLLSNNHMIPLPEYMGGLPGETWESSMLYQNYLMSMLGLPAEKLYLGLRASPAFMNTADKFMKNWVNNPIQSRWVMQKLAQTPGFSQKLPKLVESYASGEGLARLTANGLQAFTTSAFIFRPMSAKQREETVSALNKQLKEKENELKKMTSGKEARTEGSRQVQDLQNTITEIKKQIAGADSSKGFSDTMDWVMGGAFALFNPIMGAPETPSLMRYKSDVDNLVSQAYRLGAPVKEDPSGHMRILSPEVAEKLQNGFNQKTFDLMNSGVVSDLTFVNSFGLMKQADGNYVLITKPAGEAPQWYKGGKDALQKLATVGAGLAISATANTLAYQSGLMEPTELEKKRAQASAEGQKPKSPLAEPEKKEEPKIDAPATVQPLKTKVPVETLDFFGTRAPGTQRGSVQ